jgi:quaternary ammonium compound-resistance protein SugE
MPWTILLASSGLEAVWATALGRSDGLTNLLPATVFFAALTLSMLGLARAVRHIPIGTAYAVWVGIGAALTVGFAMVSGDEPVSVGKVVFLVGIVAAVVGLKVVPTRRRQPPSSASTEDPTASTDRR